MLLQVGVDELVCVIPLDLGITFVFIIFLVWQSLFCCHICSIWLSLESMYNCISHMFCK